MIIIEPVIETYDARGFEAWPVGTIPDNGFLVLSGNLAPTEVGTAMAVIAAYNHAQITPDGEDDDRPSRATLIQRIIEAESLAAPGGLRVRDTATGLTVNPSCCCGLEDWQEWNQVSPGQQPWLGHDPTPWTEHLGHTIRVWPDGGFHATPPAGTSPIEIPATDLSGLIASAHRQLQHFLNLLEPWAHPLAGDTASSLGSALATHFHVDWTAPALEALRDPALE